jgi:very-short-patch-repair endonuclease
LHGSKWIDDESPVELIHANPRPPRGVVTRRVLLHNEEAQSVGGLQVTTPARTAFDLGRRGSVSSAVARLDALARATRFSVEDVQAVAARHSGTRGLRQLESVLDLMDRGAESPRESYLRLVLIRGGLPRPQTQVPVYADDGAIVAYLDMGWPDLMVGVEYDGDHHRTVRGQYVRDIRRRDLVEDLGWRLVRVVNEDHPADILRRARRAIAKQASTVR